jgi:hypothetical protein
MGDVDRIRVTCASCGVVVRARYEHAGRTVGCPKCNAPMTIPPLQMDDDPLPADAPPRRVARKLGTGIVHWILPCLSLVIAVAALGVALFRDPLGSGISSYDFSSPEAAAKSMVQIVKNRDFKAQLELVYFVEGLSGEEMARTFEIHRTADFNDQKILFVSFTRKGKKIREIQSFEKDPETKLWLLKHVRESDVRKVNEQLAKEIEAWRSNDPTER